MKKSKPEKITMNKLALMIGNGFNDMDEKFKKVDERFTSQMAFQSMIDSGLKKKDRQNKEIVDMISATIILQTYMQMNSR